MSKKRTTCMLLVDNGSIRADATISLRRIADAAHHRFRRRDVIVVPVSARWSDRVSPDRLDGVKAELLATATERLLAEGYRRFVVVPLFFGPSRTVTSYIPNVMRSILDGRKPSSRFSWSLAPPLVDLNHECGRRDTRIARIVCDRARSVMVDTTAKYDVLVVDHGSPSKSVTAVRNHIASQVRLLMRIPHDHENQHGNVLAVEASSMERRPGRRYAFADPLLEDALRRCIESDARGGRAVVVVAPLFLSPGKHAGPGGDIACIIDETKRATNSSRVVRTAGLVGSHPLLLEILEDRFLSGERELPCV